MRPEVYGRIAERARCQLGLITDPQLVAIGTTRSQRRHLVASGRWERRGRRVLADRAAPRTGEQALLAAALDVTGSVITGETAAWLVGAAGSVRARCTSS